MAYNPNIHHRRSIRLKGYDYSQAGLYFITICCDERIHRFGKIENDEIILNEFGKIAYDEWAKLAERFPNFELDVFQIMPNHMHGIILLNDAVGAGFIPVQNAGPTDVGAGFTPAQNAGPKNVGAGFTPAQNNNGNDKRAGVNPAPTVGDIVGAYKSLAANGCLEIYKSNCVGAGLTPAPMMGKLWQRNYHEHIIRNEQSYQTISEYIKNNPAKWADDKFYIQ